MDSSKLETAGSSDLELLKASTYVGSVCFRVMHTVDRPDGRMWPKKKDSGLNIEDRSRHRTRFFHFFAVYSRSSTRGGEAVPGSAPFVLTQPWRN